MVEARSRRRVSDDKEEADLSVWVTLFENDDRAGFNFCVFDDCKVERTEAV